MTIKAVFFDVGGTLVDETRMFNEWADWLAVSRADFFAAIGATIATRTSHRAVFDMVAPGIDMAHARTARAAAGRRFTIEPRDLYPDAAPCLAACKARGLIVGIAGNQPAEAEAALAACGLATDHLAASATWGLEKPDPRFFAKIADICGLPPSAIAYIGDRVDNDITPAHTAGMLPILLRRGPWGIIHATWPEAAGAAAILPGLDGLLDVLS